MLRTDDLLCCYVTNTDGRCLHSAFGVEQRAELHIHILLQSSRLVHSKWVCFEGLRPDSFLGLICLSANDGVVGMVQGDCC